MGYPHYQIEAKVHSGSDGDLASAADLATWRPAYQPIIVRALAVHVTEQLDADATVELDHRPSNGSDTGREQVAEMTVPSGASVGNIYYQDGFEQLVKPGGELVVETDGGATTDGAADVYIFYQPAWDQPANNSDMTELTS